VRKGDQACSDTNGAPAIKEPDIPPNEPERIAALRALKMLDTPAEERFDRITRIAMQHFGIPIALVSLVDANRQWFKSRQGLDATETPRNVSFCGHAILGEDIFNIPDALKDLRFCDNPLVTGPPNIRFYAGAPLHAPGGERVGTLCVMGSHSRTLSAQDLALLRDLADCAESELERVQLRAVKTQVRSAESRLSAIIDTVVDGIVTIDRHGVIHTFNPAAERIFGHPAAEVIGQNVRLLMPEPYRSAHDGYLRNYLHTGKPKVIGLRREVAGQCQDGSTFPMDLAVSEMDINGERMFTGIVRDITERKKIERLKSEFVATVSHELRTPLTSIHGALGLLVGKHGAALSEKGRHLLEMASRNSERLTLLINDLLDLEKIESGSLNFDFKALDLATLVQQALAASDGYAHRYAVTLRLAEVSPTAVVWGDEHRLLQVLANLLSNAIKYSPQGDEVVVSVTQRAQRYRVSVQDHGRGIPDEFCSRMFQRFAQADSSDTREKGGTGLGLSVSKAIVERLGGVIDYVSELGVGTDFFFELPAWQEVPSVASQAKTRPLLLVCEDNSDVAQVFAQMLENEGFASDIATSAAGAKTLLTQRRYRALLLDLSLPDQDGLALIRELRQQDGTRDLPIVVVSGRANEGRAAWDGDALAVVDWLQKPVDETRLVRAVRHALAGNARPSILHVEDDPDVVQITKTLLDATANYSHAATLREARQRLSGENFDLILLGLELPDGSGLNLLAELKGGVPVVIFSGHESDSSVKDQVVAALVKSRASNEQLPDVVMRAIANGGDLNHD